MKYFLAILLLMPISAMCITVEEVVRLAELKTAEDLIMQVVEKEGVAEPLSAKDVIYLRERGLSENLIDYLWKQSFREPNFLPTQEGESEMIGENLRAFNTTDKAGNKVLVVTNLDEQGRPMGPPPPPRPEPSSQPEVLYEPASPQQYTPQPSLVQAYQNPVQDYYSPSVGFPVYNSGFYPYTTFYPSFSSFSFYPNYVTTYSSHPKFSSHHRPYCSTQKPIGLHPTGIVNRPHSTNARTSMHRSTPIWKSAKH